MSNRPVEVNRELVEEISDRYGFDPNALFDAVVFVVENIQVEVIDMLTHAVAGFKQNIDAMMDQLPEGEVSAFSADEVDPNNDVQNSGQLFEVTFNQATEHLELSDDDREKYLFGVFAYLTVSTLR